MFSITICTSLTPCAKLYLQYLQKTSTNSCSIGRELFVFNCMNPDRSLLWKNVTKRFLLVFPLETIRFCSRLSYFHTNIHFKLKETVSVGRISRER